MFRTKIIALLVVCAFIVPLIGHAKEGTTVLRSVKVIHKDEVPVAKPRLQAKPRELVGTIEQLDPNPITAAHCAKAYQEIADALASAPGPSLTFWNSSIIGETGSVRQEFKCFFEGAAHAVEDSISTSSSAEEMYKCRNGMRNTRWNNACVHPSQIREKMNAIKEELFDKGWTDSAAIDPSQEINQPGSMFYSGFTSIEQLPYIEFARQGIIGEALLLRALVGFEKTDQFMRAELPDGRKINYMFCVADNIADFASRCR